MPHAVSASPVRLPRRIGRYRVEEVLATGGMGSVYRAVDEGSSQRVAVKRLARKCLTPKTIAMFEREFHTLSRLRHPRVIQVYEYGVDEEGPYYSMELLDGDDLRALAPLPFERACRLLRDVASSLALLHARRLLHRDVTARNVRCTTDGRCKLIDFGAMTDFGVPRDVIGTPPHIAPEVVHGLPLDQRSDLYSLGALLYFVLTGRHAYLARTLADLPRAWRSPPAPPSALVAEVPDVVSELAQSLLSMDPLARPASAAEVIARLNAALGLEPEPEIEVAQSYLLSAPLIARESVMRELDSKLESALSGRGSLVILRGRRGLGKSRLLDEAAVRAQVKGLSVIRSGEPGGSGAHVFTGLGRALLAALPDVAHRAARPFAPALSRVVPELRAGPMAVSAQNWMERRALVQRSLVDWFVAVAREQPLVIAVDDAHVADESASAFLLGLFHQLSGARLCMLLTLASGEEPRSPAAIRALEGHAGIIDLPALDERATETLVRGLFGSVPRIERLSRWVFEQAGGVPRDCLDAAEALVEVGAVRYVEGIWVLPQDPSAVALPSKDNVERARLDDLSGTSLRLAQALCLYRDAAPLELCRKLGGAEDFFSAFDELLDRGILVPRERGYRFAHEDVREWFERRLTEAERETNHRAIGEALLALETLDSEAMIRAGFHLLSGGDELRGAELLDRGASDQLTDGRASALKALEAALEVYERQRRPLEACLRIRSKLVSAAFPVDRSLAERYGHSTIEVLSDCTGLTLARRLGPVLGNRAGLYVALGVAAARRLFTPKERRGPPLHEAFTMFLASLGSMLGVSSTCLDLPQSEALVEMVHPLTGFGPRHIGTAFYEHCLRFVNIVRGREAEAYAESVEFLRQLDEGRGFLAMSEEMRTRWKGGAWIVRGMLEVFRDGSGALDCADQLDRLGFQFHQAWAHQIRMLYYAMRGEMYLAEPERKKVEMHLLRNGSVWQLEVGPAVNLCAAYHLTGDVPGYRAALTQLEPLVATTPSLRTYVELIQADYLRCEGKTREAIASFERLRHRFRAREFIGWPILAAGFAAALNDAEDFERAREVTTSALAHVRPEDRAFVGMYLELERQRWLAEAGLGRTDVAARELDALLEEHRAGDGPLTLGSLHHARALVARRSGDHEAFERHLQAMEARYRATRNPALIAQCERLKLRRDTLSVRTEAIPAAGFASDTFLDDHLLTAETERLDPLHESATE